MGTHGTSEPWGRIPRSVGLTRGSSAAEKRRGVANARVVRQRSSDPCRPRAMCGQPQGWLRSVSRGTCRPAIEPRNRQSLGCRRRFLGRKATPHPSVTRDGQGPHGVGDPAHARKHLARETGDPRIPPTGPAVGRCWSAAGSRETHAADGRAWEVRQPRTTAEGSEQSQEAGGGGTGGKQLSRVSRG